MTERLTPKSLPVSKKNSSFSNSTDKFTVGVIIFSPGSYQVNVSENNVKLPHCVIALSIPEYIQNHM